MPKIKIVDCSFTNEDTNIVLTYQAPFGLDEKTGKTKRIEQTKKSVTTQHRVHKYTVAVQQENGQWELSEYKFTEAMLFAALGVEGAKKAIDTYWNRVIRLHGKAKRNTPDYDTKPYRKEYFTGSRYSPRITNTHYGRIQKPV